MIYGNIDLQSSEKSYKCREDRTKCFYGRFGTRGVYEQLGQEFVNMSDMRKPNKVFIWSGPRANNDIWDYEWVKNINENKGQIGKHGNKWDWLPKYGERK